MSQADLFSSPLSWYNRAPIITSRVFHPGLRHFSRLNTKPKPWIRPTDSYSDAQLKIGRNCFSSHTQLMMQLVDAKNIFSRQLPNMGSAYISRLVFDINAETVMILHNGRFMGGICSRLFFEQEFAEIVFCAVDSRYQAKGYGRLAMNFLKTVMQTYELFDMLTCADNEAVIYFKKQGFNGKEILMDPKRWIGCIKDYEGITLVHCKLYPDIDYLNFPEVLKLQTIALEKKTGTKLHNNPIATLQPMFVGYSQQPSIVSVPLTKIIPKHYKDKCIKEYNSKMNGLKNKLIIIFDSMKNDDKFGSTFWRPVTEEIAPGYFSQIKTPMDLWTIERRLKRFHDYYKRPNLFAQDMLLMCANCQKFNSTDTIYYRQAADAIRKFKQLYSDAFPEFPIE